MFGPTSILFSCGKVSRQACLTGITALILSACGGGSSGGGNPSAGASGPETASTTTTVQATTTTTDAGVGSGGTTTTSAPTSSTTTLSGTTTTTESGVTSSSRSSSSSSSSTSSTVSSTTTTTVSGGTTGAGTGYFMYGTQDSNASTEFASLSLVTVNDFAGKSVLTSSRVDYAQSIPTGTYNVGTKTITNIHPNIAVVAQVNAQQIGQWFKADLSGTGSPRLVAISPQAYGTSFGPLCPGLGLVGGLNLNRTFIVYETGGADSNCSAATDNQRFVLSVMNNAFISAIPVTSLVSSVNDFTFLTDSADASQSPTAIIAINGKNLVRYPIDANDPRSFNNPFGGAATNIATAANSIDLDIENGQHHDGFFVNMDNNIYWYDDLTNKLGNSLHTVPSSASFTSGGCDATDCYFRETTHNDNGSEVSRILRLAQKGTSGAQTVIDNIPQTIEQVAVVGASVYMVLDTQGSFTLQSVPKIGGNLATLDTSTYFSNLVVADKYIYYTKRATNVSAPFPAFPVGLNAVALDTSTSGVKETEKATWSGYVKSSSLQPDHLVLVSNISTDSAVGMSGATLQSYNAATNQIDRELGIVPNGIRRLDFFGFSNRMIGTAIPAIATNSQTDIVGLDVSQANSFNRITQTPEPEMVLGF